MKNELEKELKALGASITVEKKPRIKEKVSASNVNTKKEIVESKDSYTVKRDFQPYKQALAEGKTMKVEFTGCNGYGDLWYEDEECNVRIILRNENMSVYGSRYNAKREVREKKLEEKYLVKIRSIDEKEGIVRVARVFDESELSAVEEKRKSIDDTILKGLKALKRDEHMYVSCVVTRVHPRDIYVSLFDSEVGTYVSGHISISEYAPYYIDNLQNYCKRGDNLKVEILKEVNLYRKPEPGKYCWECSRIGLISDDFEKSITEKFQRGDVVQVRCVSNMLDGHFFMGVIEGLDGAKSWCEIPSNLRTAKNPVVAIIGDKYRAMVTGFQHERRLIRVKVTASLGTRTVKHPIFNKDSKVDMMKASADENNDGTAADTKPLG